MEPGKVSGRSGSPARSGRSRFSLPAVK